MLKFLFSFIILIHGLIHFMGFSKAYGYGNIPQLTKEISKQAGLLWLLAALLFITTLIFVLFKKEEWPVIAIIAVILSQLLIISAWKDAKFGTIANIIVLLVAVPAYGNFRFQQMVNQEAKEVLITREFTPKTITNKTITDLPPIVQKWLTRSRAINKEAIHFVRLKQKGKMRLKPGGKWMPFEAKQYFTPPYPAFVWNATVHMFPLIYMNGRDKFKNGEGEMLIKALSLIDVANEKPGKKINEGAMLRYLGEICWFPSAALGKYIQWETVDSLSAKAIMYFNGTTVSGIFQFNETGDILSFSADRYYRNDKNSSLEKWIVKIEDYKDFQGFRIPYKCQVIWKLKESDFNWLNVEITELEFNKQELYK